MAFADQVRAAAVELRAKALLRINHETALTWTARALAARQLGLIDATEYAHEALEHAGLVGPGLYGWVYTQLKNAGIV